MEEKIVSLLLDSNGYIITNKTLIRKLGLYEAVFIGELVSEYNYWRTKGVLEDDMFYSTAANITYNTGLSEDIQRRIINKLKELDIITVVRKGLPARNYFKFNFEKLNQIFEEELSSGKIQELSSGKIQELEPVKSELNNNKPINNKQINNNIPILQLDKSNYKIGSEQGSQLTESSLIPNIISIPKDKPKKKNIYEKGLEYIDKFCLENNCNNLRDSLEQFMKNILDCRRENGNPIYINQVIAKINKLKEFPADRWNVIVKDTLDNYWQNFIDVKGEQLNKEDDKYDARNKPWNQGLNSEAYTHDELEELTDLQKEREANGIKTKF